MRQHQKKKPFPSWTLTIQIFLLYFNIVISALELSGRLSEDVIISKENSPVNVTSDLIIPQNVLVRIESGAEVLFAKDSGIVVQGNLIIEGSEEEKVVLKNDLKAGAVKWRGIRFRQSSSDGLRLAGGIRRSEGRVEIRYSGNSWGFICDDGFDIRSANVICRQLGYSNGADDAIVKGSRKKFRESAGKILLDDISCSGEESNILECRNNGWFVQNCNEDEAAGVVCSGSRDSTADSASGKSSLSYVDILNADVAISVKQSGDAPKMQFISIDNSARRAIDVTTAGDFEALDLEVKRSGREAVFVSTPSTVQMSNVKLSDNDGDGVKIFGAARTDITSADIINNRGSGIDITTNSGTINIGSSYIDDNSIQGVNITHSDQIVVVMQQNSISRNALRAGNKIEGAVQITTTCKSCSSSYTIRNNNIEANARNGFVLKIPPIGKSSAVGPLSMEFVNNAIKQNRGAAIRMSRLPETLLLRINSNTIEENVNRGRNHGTIDLEFSAGDTGNVTIKDNEIYNNHDMSTLELKSVGTRLFSEFVITRNIIKDNLPSIPSRQLNTINIDQMEITQITENLLENPAATCELILPRYKANSVVKAKRNYWGKSSLSEVFKRVCDFYNDMTLTRADFLPYYERYLDDRSLMGMLDKSLFTSDGFGGMLLESFAIKPSSEPLLVTRSIYIPSNIKLTIPNGMEVQFSPGTGIFVQGSLVIKEGPLKTTLSAADKRSGWHGILFDHKYPKNTDVKLRFKDGRAKNEGRLEVSYNGRWGTVCSKGFSIEDANVACRQLGFTKFQDAIPGPRFGATAAPILLSGMQCQGGEASYADCSHAGFYNVAGCQHKDDVGLRCDSTSLEQMDIQDTSELSDFKMDFSRIGIAGSVGGLRVTNCVIKNNRVTGFNFNRFDDVEIESCLIEKNRVAAARFTGSGGIKFENSTITANGDKGLVFQSLGRANVMIFNSKIFNHDESAISITYAGRILQNVKLSGNEISGGRKDNLVSIELKAPSKGSKVEISGNKFVKSLRRAAMVQLLEGSDADVSVGISNNSFIGIKAEAIFLNGMAEISTSVVGNKFTQIDNSRGAIVFVNSPIPYGENFKILRNEFIENEARYGLKFNTPTAKRSEKARGKTMIVDNMFLDNTFLSFGGTIGTETDMLEMRGNLFLNPNTDKEIIVEFPYSNRFEEIIAADNFWGDASEAAIRQRVRDYSTDEKFGKVVISPFLKKSPAKGKCGEEDECGNGNGFCAKENYCVCRSGYEGDNCLQFDCGKLPPLTLEKSTYTRSVSASRAIGYSVLQIKPTSTNRKLKFKILEDSEELDFEVDSDGFVNVFSKLSIGETSFTVQATDKACPSLVALAPVTIKITRACITPEFEETRYFANLNEAQLDESILVISPKLSTSYEGVQFGLDGVTAENKALLQIDTENADIVLSTENLFTSPNGLMKEERIITFLIKAMDMSCNVSTTVPARINVKSICSSSDLRFIDEEFIRKQVNISSALPGLLINTFQARLFGVNETDPLIEYSLMNGEEEFYIDESNGELSLLTDLNIGTYPIEIVATHKRCELEAILNFNLIVNEPCPVPILVSQPNVIGTKKVVENTTEIGALLVNNLPAERVSIAMKYDENEIFSFNQETLKLSVAQRSVLPNRENISLEFNIYDRDCDSQHAVHIPVFIKNNCPQKMQIALQNNEQSPIDIVLKFDDSFSADIPMEELRDNQLLLNIKMIDA